MEHKFELKNNTIIVIAKTRQQAIVYLYDAVLKERNLIVEKRIYNQKNR